VCCEARAEMELMPCLQFNDYSVYTYSERLLLWGFDVAFAWIAVALTKPEIFVGMDHFDDGSRSDSVLMCEAGGCVCCVSPCFEMVYYFLTSYGTGWSLPVRHWSKPAA
jgi:hypothetical protein